MVLASQIASYLERDLIGNDLCILQPCFLPKLVEESVIFIENDHFDSELLKTLNTAHNILIISDVNIELLKFNNNFSYIYTHTPRLDFSKAFVYFWHLQTVAYIADTAIISQNVKIGANVTIGEYSIIEEGVEIGNNTKILHHCVICKSTKIGANCIVESHSIIGQNGWFYHYDKQNSYIYDYPHLGNVIISDNVHIGSYTNIDRGVLPNQNTYIASNVRINDKVHIGHGANILSGVRLAAGCIISGETKIASNVWIGPGAVIKDRVSVCDEVTIGINAVVTKNVEKTGVHIGVPAKYNDKLKKK